MASNSNSKSRLSDEQTRHLIDLYHGHDVLWNTESQGYKNQHLRDRALASIQMCMEVKFELRIEVSILKTKLQSFRNSFSKELALIKESSRSGAGVADVYIPKYQFYHELAFLQPVMKKRPSTTNLDASQDTDMFTLVCTQEREDIGLSQTAPAPSACTTPTTATCSRAPPQTTTPTATERIIMPASRSTSGRKRTSSEDSATAEVLTSISNVLQTKLSKPSNQFSDWAQYVATEISSLKDKRKQKLLQFKITTLVQEAVAEELNSD